MALHSSQFRWVLSKGTLGGDVAEADSAFSWASGSWQSNSKIGVRAGWFAAARWSIEKDHYYTFVEIA